MGRVRDQGREKIREEKGRRKKITVSEKENSHETLCFMLKLRVCRHLVRGEMKNCTPMWCAAQVEVKVYKIHNLRSTFGS